MNQLPNTPMARRQVGLGCLALWAASLGPLAAQERALRPTPAQTEGPFYPLALPPDHDADLLQIGALKTTQGEPAWLEGTVVDPFGRAVADAVVEIWQCDAQGRYHHPGDGGRADPAFQGFGRMAVGAGGAFRFRTLRPVAYSGRAPHIHVKVRSGGRERLTTQVYVAGDPGNANDALWRRLGAADQAALTVPFTRVADGWSARFPVVLAV